MSSTKRPHSSLPEDPSTTHPTKRRRSDDATSEPNTRPSGPSPPRDFLTPLSDELLLRILSYLPLRHLLSTSPVSHRLHRLSADSQLWRQLYYLHFVLPRAMRIPGFRPSAAQDGASTRTVMRHIGGDLGRAALRGRGRGAGREGEGEGDGVVIDWKRQYKLRHNWSRGKCAVEELHVGGGEGIAGLRSAGKGAKGTLAKVVDGIAVTADAASGLRAWDLKTKELVAWVDLALSDCGCMSVPAPTCMDLDDQDILEGRLRITLGFDDGSFGYWTLDIGAAELAEGYRHPGSTNGELVSVAFSYPYILTATKSILVSLYTFDVPGKGHAVRSEPLRPSPRLADMVSESLQDPLDDKGESDQAAGTQGAETVRPPCLITSLKSYSSKSPLALSIRKTPSSTIASIAFKLPTFEGWTIGIQELHIANEAHLNSAPEVFESRLAHAPVTITGRRTFPTHTTAFNTPSHPSSDTGDLLSQDDEESGEEEDHGPMALCYTHPYLLATLPDNTLILYLCTSGASALSVSRGMRLWGHTSGIGDAEITARGKAVSVSCRGDELRVWELEGRSGGRSVEIRASDRDATRGLREVMKRRDEEEEEVRVEGWDERRNWVGFDDEMVIVLKEGRSGRESLMVYDFS